MSDMDTLAPFLAEDDLEETGEIDTGVVPKRVVADDDVDGDGLSDELIDPEEFGEEEDGAFDDSE